MLVAEISLFNAVVNPEMSESFPATAVAMSQRGRSNKPSAVSKFWTSVLVAEISLFNAVVNPEMSESFPATAVANESARSFNKPSAVLQVLDICVGS